MKVTSKYLGKEFEVEVFEAMEDGETVNIIPHETLENIIYNLVDPALNVCCEYKALLISPDHSVFLCTIKDSSGRSAPSVGETTPATLETEIARNFPVLTAAKRAFDRAAKLYLGLELGGKILSDAEVDLTTGATNDGTEVVDLEKEAARAAQEACGGTNATEGTCQAKVVNAAPATSQGCVGSSNNGTVAKPAGNSAPNTVNPGAVPCEVGTFRGKNMTVADVYRDSPGYVSWIVNKYDAKTPEQIAVKNAAIEFLKTVKGGQ